MLFFPEAGSCRDARWLATHLTDKINRGPDGPHNAQLFRVAPNIPTKRLNRMKNVILQSWVSVDTGTDGKAAFRRYSNK